MVGGGGGDVSECSRMFWETPKSFMGGWVVVCCNSSFYSTQPISMWQKRMQQVHSIFYAFELLVLFNILSSMMLLQCVKLRIRKYCNMGDFDQFSLKIKLDLLYIHTIWITGLIFIERSFENSSWISFWKNKIRLIQKTWIRQQSVLNRIFL